MRFWQGHHYCRALALTMGKWLANQDVRKAAGEDQAAPAD
jgi:hypothetical protein